ncbi:MAG: alpha/beta hydrolase [Gammaproteobacteria bacterium]|nr:alpha/beta hydrolase [Gammaproteobacteria bacterium]MBU1414142.1 alpha/beta hydrolase [Gammaproteobacteria bacterium]
MTETLYMIHGMWGGPWCWDEYLAYFSALGYSCHTPTLLYHDMTPGAKPDERLGTTSLLDYAEALEKEIRQLPERPILIGHSMGALLAQMLAARNLASAVVLLTPSAPAGILGLRLSLIRSFLSAHMKWGFWGKPMLQTLGEAHYSMLHRLTPEQQKSIIARLVPDSGRAMVEAGHWYLDRQHATRVDEAKVTCPVLVIAGEEDRITPASIVRKVARKYHADYKEFPGHAHWVLAEPGWEEIAGYVADWLKQLPKDN